ncbi:hypothetical protein MKS88_003517 [Plasmodium brasilianum]|uniref:Uncharacterized protein n=1 Tax=Plasmodium brasilianum TaxID=5824 RepID=A0ACB9Y7K0_PLABR|nr:hypothetical protein MKS88_003517 [Plasmodium brasilianum]
MDTEWASKILSQLLIKEKCLKEKYVYNLLNKFGDVNQIIQHMNEKLEVLGFIVNNELIKGEEYLILNCGKLKRPENNTSVDVAFNIKEEYLFNSHFKKNEISLYYLIIDYIVNNNKYLKIDCDETSYESLCLKLNIKNTNVQKSIRKNLKEEKMKKKKKKERKKKKKKRKKKEKKRTKQGKNFKRKQKNSNSYMSLDKLIAYNWLKFEDGQLAPGLRFFTVHSVYLHVHNAH